MTMDGVEVGVERLPAFSNQRARCSKCGTRGGIRVHFDHACALVRAVDHFHRICPCGHQWIERCGEGKQTGGD